MLESLQSLIRLQNLETTLHQLKEKKNRIPEAIEKEKRPYDQSFQELEEIRRKEGEAAKERRDRERQLEAEEEKVRKLKNRTSEIKTNKEYQALLLEINSAQENQSKDEEFLLMLMEKQDEVKKDIGQKEILLADGKRCFEEKKKLLEEEIVQAGQELIRLEKERETLYDQIPNEIKEQYEKIKLRKGTVAVIPVRNGTCLGCNIHVLPQMLAELKKQEKLITCLNCNRILYWKQDE